MYSKIGKKLYALLTIPFIILSLTACSEEKSPTETAPSASSEPAITEAFVEGTAETVRESEGICIDEIANAEIDRYLSDQEKRNDNLCIYGFNFKTDSSLSIVYSAEHFDIGANFWVKPINTEEYKKAYPDGEENLYGNFELFRYFTIEKKGERYEVTGLKTEAPHNTYIAEHLLEEFPSKLIPTPDGGSADKTEAAQAYRNNFSRPALKFDFGFLRYAKPVFQSSFDNPDSFDFDTNSFKNPYPEKITDPGYFKVKAGDTLKCGLTVTKADWHIDFQSGYGIMVQNSLAECEGEVTWEGILHRCPEQDVGIEKGDLAFYPDPVKNENIPVICGKYWKSTETEKPEADITAPLWSDGGLESGGGIIDVGNYFDNEELFGGIFEENDTVRVKITLKNLVFENDETGSRTYAETVNCEIVK